MDRLGLTISFPEWENKFYFDFATYVRNKVRTLQRPIMIGLAGIQGSGKSTHANLLEAYFASQFGMTTCTMSIDDFYLDQSQRHLLSEKVHPLLKTRGVPGTHHIDTVHAVLDALSIGSSGASVSIPQFDKSIDNPKPKVDWKDQTLPVNVILFEGWCVGAMPEDDEKLVSPINALEEEDPNGVCRGFVNEQLKTVYRKLWQRMDTLVWLQPSQFEMVYTWRKKQETNMQLNPDQATASRMDDSSLKRFIMHYERISRHMIATMPERADWVVYLNDDQSPAKIKAPDVGS